MIMFDSFKRRFKSYIKTAKDAQVPITKELLYTAMLSEMYAMEAEELSSVNNTIIIVKKQFNTEPRVVRKLGSKELNKLQLRATHLRSAMNELNHIAQRYREACGINAKDWALGKRIKFSAGSLRQMKYQKVRWGMKARPQGEETTYEREQQ